MEEHELIRRAEDLAAQCERKNRLTATAFLSPAERRLLEQRFARAPRPPVFFGGHPDCERTLCFFLPDYLEPEELDAAEYLRAIRLTAHFGMPGHRDYMGALLGMGIARDRLGDIWVEGDTATVFCLPGVEKHLLSIDRVGRVSVTAEALPLEAAQAPERKVKALSFTVMSPRLDAAAAGMFRLSRTEAARRISLGLLTINDLVSDKPDLIVHEGDVISLRGEGKGRIASFGGSSRKGRLYVNAEIYL